MSIGRQRTGDPVLSPGRRGSVGEIRDKRCAVLERSGGPPASSRSRKRTAEIQGRAPGVPPGPGRGPP